MSIFDKVKGDAPGAEPEPGVAAVYGFVPPVVLRHCPSRPGLLVARRGGEVNEFTVPTLEDLTCIPGEGRFILLPGGRQRTCAALRAAGWMADMTRDEGGACAYELALLAERYADGNVSYV